MRPLHFLMAIFTLVLGGCVGGPPDIVGIVKAGTLPSHPTKTIGKAFDEAFPGGTWDAEMTGMGEMYAHFRSTATAEDLEVGGVPGIDHEMCIDGVTASVPGSGPFSVLLEIGQPDHRVDVRRSAGSGRVRGEAESSPGVRVSVAGHENGTGE